MTTAYGLDPADIAAAAFVHQFLATNELITVEYRSDLIDPYAVDERERLAIVPSGLPWPVEHARLNRCWLYLTGGARLAPEFTEPEPGPRIASVIPLSRRR